jgi:hypothetical protein
MSSDTHSTSDRVANLDDLDREAISQRLSQLAAEAQALHVRLRAASQASEGHFQEELASEAAMQRTILPLEEPKESAIEPRGPPNTLVGALLWNLPQASAATNVSGGTLKRMAAANELPEGAVVHLGRRRLFNRLILEKWVAAGCPAVTQRRRTR